MTEKAWKGAGEKVGLRIWRIVKFKASVTTTYLTERLLIIKFINIYFIVSIYPIVM